MPHLNPSLSAIYLSVKSAGFLTLFISMFFSAGLSANATDVNMFLHGLDGSYHGRGKALYSDGKKTLNVSCQIANKVSNDGEKLKISGVCATTQGKAPVNGELHLNGTKVSGAFFSPNSNLKLTKSWGQIIDDELIVTSFFINEQSGALTRIKQIVHRNEEGFNSSILTYDNSSKKFEKSGSIAFVKN